MSPRAERAGLRSAVYLSDGALLVSILKAQQWPDDALQLIGDGRG